jgi:hypothetical protein
LLSFLVLDGMAFNVSKIDELFPGRLEDHVDQCSTIILLFCRRHEKAPCDAYISFLPQKQGHIILLMRDWDCGVTQMF